MPRRANNVVLANLVGIRVNVKDFAEALELLRAAHRPASESDLDELARAAASRRKRAALLDKFTATDEGLIFAAIPEGYAPGGPARAVLIRSERVIRVPIYWLTAETYMLARREKK